MEQGLFDLSGCVAIVSGGAGWLGLPMVDALATHGARVIAVARDADNARKALAGVRGDVSFEQCDITTDAWPALIERIGAQHGRIDVLVNNAHGGGRGGSMRTAAASDYRAALELAVIASANGMNAARAGFAGSVAAQGSPSVINVATMYGVVSPNPGIYDTEAARNPPFYGAAKAGMIQLTRYAAAELGPLGVRVNAITPGPFPGLAAQADPAFMTRLADKTMVKRIGTPKEIKTVVLFLASPHSSFVTGTTIPIDGGWTAW